MKKNIRHCLIAFLLTLAFVATSFPADVTTAATYKLSNCKTTLCEGTSTIIKANQNCGTVKWASSDKDVACVTNSGKVIAKNAGTTKITATCKGVTITCKITVNKQPIASCNPRPQSTPVVTSTPCPTSAPNATSTPVVTSTPKPTSAPVVTSTPKPTSTPVVTSTPNATSTPDSSDSSMTEAKAYSILNGLRSTYPEGMTLNNSYFYRSPMFGNGYACYGFAAKLSDTVFGTQKAYTTHSNFSSIRVGDNIRIGNYHSVIVLTKSDNYITVVEGNYNSSVHWDRKITSSSLSSSGFRVYTRY